MNADMTQRSRRLAVALALQLLVLGAHATASAAGNGDYCGRWGLWVARCDAGLRCEPSRKAGAWLFGVCVSAAQTCGGLRGLDCPKGQFCDFTDQSCGAADQTGVCEQPPTACTREFRPVCGCNGTTYDNPCLARAAGVSIATDGACAAACKVAGCSSELCVSPDDPGISTCIFRPEFACYHDATCTLQADGACGWTVSDALTACLEDASADAGVVALP